jgi:small subunit ribosomal protein S27Ae
MILFGSQLTSCPVILIVARHKKVKLAVLKFYKVDGDNKIRRLRRECPSDVCGPGVFMAQHEDRHYCGKCQATFRINA